jgi:hypothetical protein
MKKILFQLLIFIGLFPIGALLGILIGLISDFGVINLFQNIKINPDIFINQYSSFFVVLSAISPFSLVALFLVYKFKTKYSNSV